jgi:hypothetical protein
METINIPAASARARRAGVGGGGEKEEKIKVCFKTSMVFFTHNLAAPTSLPNRLILRRPFLIKTSYYCPPSARIWVIYSIQFECLLGSIKRGRNMTK